MEQPASPSRSQLEELICRCNQLERTVRDQENDAEMQADTIAKCQRLETVAALQDETIEMLENKLSQFEEERHLLTTQAESDIGVLRSLQSNVDQITVERDTAKRQLADSVCEVVALTKENRTLAGEVKTLSQNLQDAKDHINYLQIQIDQFNSEDMSAFFTRAGKRDNIIRSNAISIETPPTNVTDEQIPVDTNGNSPLPPNAYHYFGAVAPQQPTTPSIQNVDRRTSEPVHVSLELPEKNRQIKSVDEAGVNVKAGEPQSSSLRKETPPAGCAFMTVRQRRREQQMGSCMVPPSRIREVNGERGLKGTQTHELLVVLEKVISPTSACSFEESLNAEEWVSFEKVDENCEPYQKWLTQKLQM